MLPFDKSDSIDDESDNDGSDSGSDGTCTFSFRFNKSVGRVDGSIGRVRGVGSGVFVLIGVKSVGDVVPLVVFVPIGFESKGT